MAGRGEGSFQQQRPGRSQTGRTDSIEAPFPRHVEAFSDSVPLNNPPLPDKDDRDKTDKERLDHFFDRYKASGRGRSFPSQEDALREDTETVWPGHVRPTSPENLYPEHTSRTSSRAARRSKAPSPAPPPKEEAEEPRRCWICYDEEDPDAKGKGWVHPCRCSLVAHEACLLTWITTHQFTHQPPRGVNRTSAPVTCPQCSSPYTIVQPSSPLLSLLTALKRRYDSALGYFGLAGLMLGGSATMGLYGLWAARCFLGLERFNRWTSRPGAVGVVGMLQLSLVGPVLISARTRVLDSVLPFLPLSIVLSSIPPPSQIQVSPAYDVDMEWAFPPSPVLTLCLLPWARLGWSWLWERIGRFIINRERRRLRMPQAEAARIEQAEHPADFPFQVQFEILRGADPAPRAPAAPAEADADAGLGRQEPGQPGVDDAQQAAAMAVAADPAQGQAVGAQALDQVNDWTSLRKIFRLALGALVFPLAASFAGSVLLVLARRSVGLQKILGIRIFRGLGAGGQSAAGSRLWPGMTAAGWWGVWRYATNAFRSHPVAPPTSLSGANGGYLVAGLSGDFSDPVWWRNAVGGSLIVVGKDVINLTEKVLELRKIGRRRVAGYPLDQIGTGSGTRTGARGEARTTTVPPANGPVVGGP